MAKANRVMVRLSIQDLVLTQEEAQKLPSYLQILDENGEKLTESEIWTVGYEDEDGNECHEDGECLN